MTPQTEAKYQQQERGGGAEYERYLAGMDASMQQKVALTAAHILGQGWVADMGMGSGTGSEALAALYPKIRVTGVDINPEMVERASKRYTRDNLDFRAGDIGSPCFEPESLDAIFNSSVLHHVTTFNDYDISRAASTLESQVTQLKTHGSLIVRDFLRPESAKVWLDLPLETAELFLRFAQEFRFLRPQEQRGFSYQELESPEEGWRRFLVDKVHAVEFVLRKDYTQDWETEVLEEYTYFTQVQFEELFAKFGLRILASTPIRNPWIVNNRFEGQFKWHSDKGAPLELPPTNYLIVGEKVAPGQGVTFSISDPRTATGFLEFNTYRHRQTGSLRDLVRRPNLTVDALPYFFQNGELYVIARQSYPRPLLGLCQPRLDEARSPNYVTEPIAVIQGDKPLAQTVEEALEEWAGLLPDQLRRFDQGSVSYPSPGGLQEEIRSLFVEVDPVMVSGARDRVRAIEAQQLLRAAQVGGLPDARLETHCFELMRRLQVKPGPWIGEKLKLLDNPLAPPFQRLQDLFEDTPRRAFQKAQEKADFLHLGSREFVEETAQGESVRTHHLDYVAPKALSLSTVVSAPLWKHDGQVYFGLADEDFPAAQCFCGHSNLLVAPAWRLPKAIRSLGEMEKFLVERLETEYGLTVRRVFELGGAYFPSPGVTPEVVYPLACDVTSQSGEGLLWVPLSELSERFDRLRDGHLRTVTCRAIRASL